MSEVSKVEIFVSGDLRGGNVWRTPWGDVVDVKIPMEEMALDPERTIRAKIWKCPHCGYLIDSPNHQLGCEGS